MRNDWTMQQGQEEGSAGQTDGGGRKTPTHEPVARGEAAESPPSWKVEVVVDDSGEWESDPFRFETRSEALAYARDLDLRWAAVRDRRVVESADPVNWRRPEVDDGRRQ